MSRVKVYCDTREATGVGNRKAVIGGSGEINRGEEGTSKGMDLEGGIEEEADAEENIIELNGTLEVLITELDETESDTTLERSQEEVTVLDGAAQPYISDNIGRDYDFAMDVTRGARPKNKEQLQGRHEELIEPPTEDMMENTEHVGPDQEVLRSWSRGTHKKILRQVGRSWGDVAENTRKVHGKIAGQNSQDQEAGLKLVRDLLGVVTRSDLPLEEKLELEFVTLQFMMGGNVHLLGELQSQAVVEDFRQEVFAKFPIPAFHVTSSVICCDQAETQRPEKTLFSNENGCSRQQERIYSQLIFFLCRAPFLKSWEQLDRLAEMLHKLKNCIYYTPVALVGVIVQVDPDPGLDAEQEARARRWLRCLLDGFFCSDLLLDHDGTEPEVQVQVAVYQSGQPERALEIKRAACQAIRAALQF